MKLNTVFPKMTIISSTLLFVSACGDDGQPTDLPAEIQTLSSTGIVLTSPIPNFVIGQALDIGETPSTQTHTVTGWVRVEDNNGNDNTPSVVVNQQVATVTASAFATDCPDSAPFLCFQFATTLNLDKGAHSITATATDTKGNSYSETVDGMVDYCRKGGFDPGIPALFQTDPTAIELQNNRCHEIDGCSVYITEADPLATSQTRNDPSSINNSRQTDSTAFGSGEVPPNSEYFVHGQMPTEVLPCNTHDICYQTINGKTQEQCDNQMLADMKNVCNRAYPGDCPSDLSNTECLEWKGQKETCEAFANSYFAGLTAVGSVAFDERQAQYR
ncbi:MAG: hypothetical protein PVJ72_17955 [Gammaproteobacteria bacterium]|jgi:hypothetical protein